MVTTLAEFSLLFISFRDLIIWFHMTLADVHIFSVKYACAGAVCKLRRQFNCVFAAPLNAPVT